MSVTRAGTFLVTYCSREKNPSPGLLPAAELYLSPRIRAVGEASLELSVEFLILSGLYGLLTPGQEIPDYDHLLTAHEIPGHARTVVRQLKERDAARVIFITRTMADDPGTGPYREVMRLACEEAGVGFAILKLPSPPPGRPAARADHFSRVIFIVREAAALLTRVK